MTNLISSDVDLISTQSDALLENNAMNLDTAFQASQSIQLLNAKLIMIVTANTTAMSSTSAFQVEKLLLQLTHQLP